MCGTWPGSAKVGEGHGVDGARDGETPKLLLNDPQSANGLGRKNMKGGWAFGAVVRMLLGTPTSPRQSAWVQVSALVSMSTSC